jgi:phenylalanyl-tRNA synthetase beta chain
MKLSLNWLKEFVDVAAEPRELKAALISAGLGVESFVAVGNDVIFEIEVTTNRPDCLSHLGVAREVSAIYGLPLKASRVSLAESGCPASEEVAIEIADPDLCARYCGRVIRGVQVKPSPAWLVERLEAVGQRAINNVADITNYVLMELGHPLHAFDLVRIRQRRIVVRRARAGEQLSTLDGMDRTLTPDNLVIADAERAVALAGIMGGEDSEISPRTVDVLLESAWFDPISVRRTAKSHGLHTEASHRFERGADIEMAPHALDRCAQMIQEIAGGESLRGVIDVYPRTRTMPVVTLRAAELRRALSIDLLPGQVEDILRSLGFTVASVSAEVWRVTPPSYRVDIAIESDLIEEIARIYGYDRLPSRLRPAPPRPERDTRREKELEIGKGLVGLGYREIITMSMVDPEESARFSDEEPVLLLNPLSQEASAMRTSLAPSMVSALRWNLDRNHSELRLFEMGKAYTRGPDKRPAERRLLSLGLSGHRRCARVDDDEKPLNFFDLKGDIESLSSAFSVDDLRFEPAGAKYLEPGLAGRYVFDGNTLVTFGRLSEAAAREYKLRQDVWLAEIDLDALLLRPFKSRVYQPFSKFPAMDRDFSLIVPEAVTYAMLEKAVHDIGMVELRGFRPVDLFRGRSIPSGYYSLLLRVELQSMTRTLTSDETETLAGRLLAALEPLGVELRS